MSELTRMVLFCGQSEYLGQGYGRGTTTPMYEEAIRHAQEKKSGPVNIVFLPWSSVPNPGFPGDAHLTPVQAQRNVWGDNDHRHGMDYFLNKRDDVIASCIFVDKNKDLDDKRLLEEYAQRILHADIVMMGSGSPPDFMHIAMGSGLAEIIKQAYQNGAILVGDSSGSVVVSDFYKIIYPSGPIAAQLSVELTKSTGRKVEVNVSDLREHRDHILTDPGLYDFIPELRLSDSEEHSGVSVFIGTGMGILVDIAYNGSSIQRCSLQPHGHCYDLKVFEALSQQLPLESKDSMIISNYDNSGVRFVGELDTPLNMIRIGNQQVYALYDGKPISPWVQPVTNDNQQ